MRRVLFMVLLALALPMVALADSVSFTNDGTLNNAGTLTGGATATYTGSATTGYTLTAPLVSFTDNGVVTATSGTVSLSTSAITAGTFTGTLTITDSSNAVLFTSSVTNGTLTNNGNGSYTLTGLLPGGAVSEIIGAKSKGIRMVTGGGNSVTGTSVVPEPGTLGLLGTGLVGIAGLIRRKTRIG